jgi:hypothetical protein
MASADFAGRLRLHPDGRRCSQIPKHQPLGTLLLHPIGNLGSCAAAVAAERVQTGPNGGVIDHTWTRHGTLLVLTRENPSTNMGIFSMLRIFQQHENGGWLQVRSVEYRHLASHVVTCNDFIVVGHGSGASIYCLSSLLSNDISQPIELLICNGVHAMCIAGSYLAVAAGVNLGVWNLNDLNSCQRQQAMWTTALSIGLERATCLVMSKSGRTIALACWDGTLRVFRKSKETDTVWALCQVGGSPWEVNVMESKDARFPMFAVLHETVLGGHLKEFVAMSAPGSCKIRFFDLELYEELGDKLVVTSGLGDDKAIAMSVPSETGAAVYGMLGTIDADNQSPILLWADGTDVIHKQDWACLWFNS